MKVAFVISTLDAGGAEQLLVNLLNNLPVNVDPYVFVLWRKTAIAHRVTNQRVRVEVVGLRSRGDLIGWVRLLRGIRRVRPDLLHSHMFLSNSICRLLKPLSGASALINHEHGLSAWKSQPLCWFDRLSQGLANRIIVVSEASQAIRIERFGIRNDRIGVLHNAVDWSYWAATPNRSTMNGRTRWGIATRLIPLKRVHLALDVLARARGNGADCELWIAGDGPERPKLEEMSESLGTRKAVRFLGHVEDMRSFYSEIDALLLTSASEDFPVSLLEGLACGKYVAATNIGGVPELLAGAPDSFLIADHADVDKAADNLANVPAGFHSAGNRDHCRQFDIHPYVEKLVGVYGEVLGHLC